MAQMPPGVYTRDSDRVWSCAVVTLRVKKSMREDVLFGSTCLRLKRARSSRIIDTWLSVSLVCTFRSQSLLILLNCWDNWYSSFPSIM